MKEVGQALNEELSDEELVTMALAGREDVFAVIYQRYYYRAYRLAYGMTGRHEESEDLTQEVFIRAFQHLSQFAGRSKFSTWFYRLAINHYLNRGSRRKEFQPETEEVASAAADSLNHMEKLVLQKQVQDQIHQALLSLKPKYRVIVILKDIEGLSYEEIAEQVGCSSGTLGTRLKRARRLLARKLEHLRGTF